MKKITLLMLTFLILATGCNREGQTEKEEDNENYEGKEQVTEVEAVLLKKDEFSKELSANGKISAINNVEIRTKLNEPVMLIKVKNGQWVNAGETIAVLDTFELYHSFIRQKIQYEKARLDFADALVSLGYVIDDLDNVPKDQRRNAEMRSGVILAETDFALAKDKYLSAFIKAPVYGQVANLDLNEGNYPANGGYFCSIINNKRLNVDFYILEEEASIVSKGLKIDVSPFYNVKIKEKGQITAINPTVENGLIWVTAVITSETPALYDGITVKVYVKSASKQCLAVPKEAIVLRTGKKVVFTYNKGEQTAMWNYVETGEENSTHVEITKGLKEMDTVIVSGNLHLGNDVPCTISNVQ